MAGAANKEHTVGEMDNSLVIQCMEFTKHLASHGYGFKFSLSLPSGFNFTLDVTQEELPPSNILERKKQSPSTLKRNALRKNFFYKYKNLEKPAGPQLVDIQIESEDKMIKCNQCDNRFKCNNTLEVHMREKHSQQLTCDECNFTSKTANSMEEHILEKHRIEQIDGNSESFKTPGEIEHLRRYGKIDYTLWCYDCDEEYCSRLGFKRHMHNEHSKTVFEDIDISKHGWH